MYSRLNRHLVSNTNASPWGKRLVVSLTLLVWTILGAAVFWLVGHVINTLILFAHAALLAYALYPAVQLFQRVMPRPLAVVLVYLVVLSGLVILLYVLVRTSIDQVISLTHFVQSLLSSERNNQLAPLVDALNRIGISQDQIQAVGQQLVIQLQGLARGVLPFVSRIVNVLFNVLVVATLSIYLLLDGSRIPQWLRHNTPQPQRRRINTFCPSVHKSQCTLAIALWTGGLVTSLV
jgi:predicted PurR-regulated permease PerM